MRLAFFLKLKKHDRIITLKNLRFFHGGKSEKKKKKKVDDNSHSDFKRLHVS